MITALIQKALSFPANLLAPPKEENENLRGLTFMAVIFDDWHGLRHPIGIVHQMQMADGQTREIFTFCCKGERQPEMALFVKKREGNLASGLVLCHEEMERIPTVLKKLPNDYKDAHFAGQEPLAMVG